LKLSFTTLAYPELGLPEILGRAEAMGFEGVEIRVADDGIHLKPEFPPPRALLDELGSYRLEVPVLSSYVKLTDISSSTGGRVLGLVEKLARIADVVGAQCVRVYGGRLGADIYEGLKILVKCYNEASRAAGKHGVSLLLETHDNLAQIDRIEGLVSISGDELKFLYDPANIIFAGGSHYHAYRILSRRIAHVHLKDFIVRGEERVFTKPGEGVVPIAEIVSDLKQCGYSGYLSVEWERFWHRNLPSGDEILPIYRDYLRGLI